MFDWNSSKVFITGGTGFVGSHLVDSIVKHKPRQIVCLYQDLRPGSFFQYKKLSEKVTMVQGDVRDFDRVLNTLLKYDIDTILHLAAQPIVEVAFKWPIETIETNIMGTVNILEAARIKGNVRSLVVASSDKAYGKAKVLPYKEDQSLNGDHPYDVSKTAADMISRTYYKMYGLPIVVPRFANIFGAGDLNFNRLFPGIFEAIIKKKEFLVRSDGKMIREYVCVDDVVDGYLALVERIDDIKGEAFNFGSENIFSVIDVLKNIEEILHTKIDYKILNIAKAEIPEQYLNWAKARTMLGWKPRVGFSTAVKKAFHWYKTSYFA